jgi:hypothetical protein
MSRALGALWIVSSLAVPAAATTYRMVDDPDLADQAPAIVEAVVTAFGSAPGNGAPATDYRIEVERWIRGRGANGLTVRVPGGRRSDGLGLKVWGAPELGTGERVLLFLAPNGDGSFHILHLMLGAFHVEAADGGRRIAARDLSEAKAVDGTGDEDAPRDFERFREWLADRAAGARRDPDYFVEADFTRPIRAPYRLLGEGGVRLRWFEFDEGGSVSWSVNRAGQPGILGGGFPEIQRALATWNAEPSTPVHYAYAGTTVASGGLARFDGINTIAFDQPVAEPFDCDRGGILAIGGPWYDTRQRVSWGGEEFIPITGADVVTNQGIGCWLTKNADPSRAAEELFGHELGHTLGLSHSCGDAGSGDCANPALNDALMRAWLHGDGRGARLSGDDRAALQSLYSPGSGPVPPAAPANLMAEIAEPAGLAANLLWEDRTANEQGFRVYRSVAGGPLSRVAELPAGIAAWTDASLKPGTRYEYQVSAYNARGESRGPRVALAVPPVRPLSTGALTSGNARTGEPVAFAVSFSGPAQRARWNFGTGVAMSDSPCAPGTFCATHIFTQPGEHTVKVLLQGDLGQTLEKTVRVRVEGPALAPPEDRRAFFLPGISSASRSGLWLANGGSSPALVRVSFQPRGAASSQALQAWKDVTLAPGASLAFPDVLAGLFGTSGQGALFLTPLLPEDRIYAFSQTPAEPETGWSADEKLAAGLLQGDGIVSTLLLANLDATAGRLTVDLFDSEGQPVGSPAVLALEPHAYRSQLLDKLFPETGRHTGPFSARFRSDGIRFSASASLTGGELETPVLLPARAVSPVSGGRGELFIPRMARGPGAFNTFHFSKLVMANPSPRPLAVRCELRLRGAAAGDSRAVDLTLPAQGSITVEDALRDLFALTEAAGSLRITWDDPVAPRILSLAVSAPRGGTGRRFATLVDSVEAGGPATARSVSFGAEPSTLVRASYGVVNLSDTPAVLTLSLKASSGAVRKTVQVTLRPRQHLERDLQGYFPEAGPGHWTVSAEVASGGPVLTYLSQTGAGGSLSFVSGSAD